MDGIFEEISRLDLLDPVASAELGQDVVYAVQTGRDLIQQQECDCLTASDYTSDLPRSAAMLSYAAALSIIIVALASAASLLILALTLIAVLGLLVAALCIRILWQFRDVFTPLGILIGGAWVFQRNLLRRQS